MVPEFRQNDAMSQMSGYQPAFIGQKFNDKHFS
jgi:hypothetical protein